MATDSGSSLDRLRAAAATPGGKRRLIEVAAVVAQEVAPVSLVVVGGLAVAAWTNAEATDIDVLLPQTIEVRGRLEGLGLVRGQGERHWRLPGTGIALEAPGSRIADGEVAIEVFSPSGLPLKVLSPADLLAWRLEEFVATGHPEVAEQMVLLRLAEMFDADQFGKRAKTKGIELAASLLEDLVDTWPEGAAPDELQAIALEMRKVCYPRRDA